MKKCIAFAALALLLAGGASAEGVRVRPLVGAGITVGGDRIASVRYDTGATSSVHAGGLLAVTGGVELQFTPLVSLQTLLSYHTDWTGGSNGSVRFERTPVELLGHIRLNDWVRLGGGARYTANAKTRSSGEAARQLQATGQIDHEDFKPSLGGVVEAELTVFRGLAVKLRYVSEKFRSKSYPYLSDVDGSHGGVYVVYYFN